MVFGYRSMNEVAANAQQLESKTFSQFQQADELRSLQQQSALVMARYLNSPEHARVELRSDFVSLNRDLDSLLGEAADAADGADRSRLELVAATHEELHPVEERVLQLTDDGQLQAARDALLDEYLPGAENVSDAIAAFLVAQEQDVDRGSQQVLDGTRQAVVVVLVVLGATAAVLVYLLRVNHLQKLLARRRECEREAFATGQVRRSRIRNAFEMSLSEADSLTTFRSVLEQELKGWRRSSRAGAASSFWRIRALLTCTGP